eukprot:6645683-Pyramimonas_sp.AAC.1
MPDQDCARPRGEFAQWSGKGLRAYQNREHGGRRPSQVIAHGAPERFSRRIFHGFAGVSRAAPATTTAAQVFARWPENFKGGSRASSGNAIPIGLEEMLKIAVR